MHISSEITQFIFSEFFARVRINYFENFKSCSKGPIKERAGSLRSKKTTLLLILSKKKEFDVFSFSRKPEKQEINKERRGSFRSENSTFLVYFGNFLVVMRFIPQYLEAS